MNEHAPNSKNTPRSDSELMGAFNDRVKQTPDLVGETLEKYQQQVDEMDDPEFYQKHRLLYEQLNEKREEYRDLIFSEINPYGLPLEKVKQNLEQQIEDLRLEVEELKRSTLDPVELNNKYETLIEKIRENNDWIQKIEACLDSKSSGLGDFEEEYQDEKNYRQHLLDRFKENTDPDKASLN